MNVENNMNFRKQKITLLISIILVSILVSPLLLDFFIFQNDLYSGLSNGEWASFLGSYIGGIIGGGGTLAAVAITTKETRKIQKEAVDYQNRLLNDEFKSKIVELVSIYIADIEKYYDGQTKQQIVDCAIANRALNELKIYLDSKNDANEMMSLMGKIHDCKLIKTNEPQEKEEFYNNTDKLLKLCAEYVENQ